MTGEATTEFTFDNEEVQTVPETLISKLTLSAYFASSLLLEERPLMISPSIMKE